jgi:hypothetical protein
MSSTPPRKGQKRPAPQTPSDKPPPKASRPSSPTTPTRQSTSGSRAARRGLQREDIPVLRAGTGLVDLSDLDPAAMATDEPSRFTVQTTDDEIDDEEAESSFKELTDWTRYVAQHKGQRQRLLAFTVEVASLLRDLMGLPEEGKPTSYAAAAATSAPGPRFPKKATPAPTTKHIQHAITRFERVSKELPGAPRDTLLKVVSQSNLRSAPTPLAETPKPRKKQACLVKGIRANPLSPTSTTS